MKTTTIPPQKRHDARTTPLSNNPNPEETPIAFYFMMGLLVIALLMFVGALFFTL